MTEPLAALRDALDGAVADVAADAGPPASAPALERPRQADHGDYATNAAMLLTKTLGQPAARDRPAARRRARRAPGRRARRARRSPGPGFLNLTLGDDWYAGALADVLARRRDVGRRQRRSRAVGERRVRQREPDRPGPRRRHPQRRLRRRARAAPRLPSATRRIASTTSTTHGTQIAPPRRVDPGPRRAARSRPTTATRATTSPSSRPRSRAPATCRSARSPSSASS